MSERTVILFCRCARSHVLPNAVTGAVFERVMASGQRVEAVDDLCGLAARRDPSLARLAEAGRLRIAACFPRAVRWLFAAAGADLPEHAVIANMRTRSADDVVAALLAVPSPHQGEGESPVSGGQPITITLPTPSLGEGSSIAASRDAVPDSPIDIPAGWLPWFPVIDFSRCNHCRQCLNFCLFGVYAVSADQKVQVKNPAACKTNCPACARVCPQAAIIFPKYKAAPINGDEVTADNLRAEDAGGDLAGLLDKDLYAALRQRAQLAKERFASERDRIKAAQERAAFLGGGPASDKPLLSLTVAGIVPRAAMQVLDAARKNADAKSARDMTANPPNTQPAEE